MDSSMGTADLQITVEKDGNVAILRMLGKENRLNTSFFQKYMQALDEIEKWDDVKALVTTGTGKFYSNGIDLEYLGSLNRDDTKKYWIDFLNLRRRILFYPMVTIAAINGHCFAGGMLLSLLHDYRVQQRGRGWMCMNEIDLGMMFTPALKAILECKLTPKMMREVTIYGKRFTAEASLDMGFVDRISDQGKAVETAVEYAKSLVAGRTYTRQTLSEMKQDLYGHLIFDDSDVFLGIRVDGLK